LAIAIRIRAIDIVICSCNLFFIEPVCGLLVSKINQSVTIFDISSSAWFESPIQKSIVKKLFSYGSYRISPTHSLEILLRIGGLSSSLVPDLPDGSFKPSNPETRRQVCDIFHIDKTAVLIGIFMDHFQSPFLAEFARTVTRPVIFFVFGNCKQATTIEMQLKKLNTTFAQFIYVPRRYDIYPFVLASCHLGICWNGSPDVVNIAPEILELEACEIPIACFRFGCVSERVHPNSNGFLFDSDLELKPILENVIAHSGETGLALPGRDLRAEWCSAYQSAFAHILT
jgi:hypothetical protein